MHKSIRSFLASTGVLLVAGVVLMSACTKGRTVGGTEDQPAAVETAGAPPVPEHAPEDADSHNAAGAQTHPAGEEKQPAH